MDRSGRGRNHNGRGKPLLFLTLAVFLLVLVPLVLIITAPLDRSIRAASVDSPAVTMFETMIEGPQKSALFIVAALGFLSFRKLVPVLWPLFQASLSGLLIAAEIAVVFWLVYGGLAEIGMPGLFWAPSDGRRFDRPSESRFSCTGCSTWCLLATSRSIRTSPGPAGLGPIPPFGRRHRAAGISRTKSRPCRRGHSDSMVSRLCGAASDLDPCRSSRTSRDAAR